MAFLWWAVIGSSMKQTTVGILCHLLTTPYPCFGTVGWVILG